VRPGGNALLTLVDGGLGSQVSKLLDIEDRDHVRVLDRDADRLAIKLNRRTGSLDGKFTDPADSGRDKIRGVVFRKQGFGSGFFLDEGKSGSVRLEPQSP
jgi:hypothetical protein